MKKAIPFLITAALLAGCSAENREEKSLPESTKPAEEPVKAVPDRTATEMPESKQNVPDKDKKKKPVKAEADWTGIYQNESGNILTINGPASDGVTEIHMSQGKAGCTDVIEGIAYLVTPSSATFTGDAGCHADFMFSAGTVQVHEADCPHGANCGTFSGIYRRK